MPVSTRHTASSTGDGAKTHQSKLNFGVAKPTAQASKTGKPIDGGVPAKAVALQNITVLKTKTPTTRDEVLSSDDIHQEVVTNTVKTLKIAEPVIDVEATQISDSEQPTPKIAANSDPGQFSEEILPKPNTLPHSLFEEQEEAARRITDDEIDKYLKQILSQRAGPQVHHDDLPRNEKILRHFDLSSQFGPCVGISRFKRWTRADRFGLEPPIEVLAVLVKIGFAESGDESLAPGEELDGTTSTSCIDNLLASHLD